MKGNAGHNWATSFILFFSPRIIPTLRYGLSFILAICFLTFPQAIYGQSASIKASVNKTHFSTDELVILTLTVVNDSPQQPRPLIPRLDGLAVIDLDLATNVTSVNGKLYTEVVFTYRLQPRRTGSLTIPPIPIEIGDQIFEAQPISIEVTQGQAPLPARGNEVSPADITPPSNLRGQDFFIETLVDIQRPFVHQQIIHTFRFYQAIQLYKEPQYDEPLFTGFETVGLPVRQYNLDIDGRTYLITEIRTMLFPKNIGTVTIRPARLVLLGNFYEDPVEMYSESLTIEVQPLPANAPPHFNGAVGQYEIKVWFSPQVAVINQPSTLYVAISGVGNMNLLPEPIWPQTDWWRAYDTLTSLTTDITEDKLMTGTRVFERLIVPGQVGEHTIPPVNFIYFDPLTGEYRTITSDSIQVEIIPAPTPEPVTPTPLPPAPTSTPASLAANPDFSLPGQADSSPQPDPIDSAEPFVMDAAAIRSTFMQLSLTTLLFLGMCSMLPLAAAAGAGGLWWWQRRRQEQPANIINKTPLKAEALEQPGQTIHPVLATAMKGSNDNYKTVNQAFNIYFEKLLGKSVNGLTRDELLNQLRQHKLDKSLIAEVEDCLAQCEINRYGPPPKDAGWSLMALADELLFKLDDATGHH